jgi:hypothetical protein
MHQERNMGESIISTCMNITDKTKDNPKARKDLALICRRPTMELGENQKKPHAPLSIKPKRKKQLMKWLKNLKFPDGYVACFRRSVILKTGKFSGLKSHDYHIIMERLLPVCLQAPYGQEMVQCHGQEYDWRSQPIDPQAAYASAGGQAHGRWDYLIWISKLSSYACDSIESMIYYTKCMVHSCRLGIFYSTIDSRELRRRGQHSTSSSSQSSR